MYKASLAADIRPMRDLGACRDDFGAFTNEITGHNTGIIDECVGFLNSPVERRETRPTA